MSQKKTLLSRELGGELQTVLVLVKRAACSGELEGWLTDSKVFYAVLWMVSDILACFWRFQRLDGHNELSQQVLFWAGYHSLLTQKGFAAFF